MKHIKENVCLERLSTLCPQYHIILVLCEYYLHIYLFLLVFVMQATILCNTKIKRYLVIRTLKAYRN